MIHLSQLSGDEKILRSRFQDAMDAARFKNQRKFVGFLDVRQQEILKAVALSVNGDESLLSSFPIVPLTARFREQDKLSHRDFLGSLMSLRISREMVGDILVGDGLAVFFVLEQAVSPILSEMKKVGRIGVSISKGAQDLEAVQPILMPLSGTVHSQRLDAVVSFLTGLSRNKAQEFIRQELVKVDGQIRVDVSGRVEAQSQISVRGYGKYMIKAFGGVTKKGRLHIAAGHYQ